MTTRLRRAVVGAAIIAAVGIAALVFASLASTARIHPDWQPGHQTLYRFEYRGEGVYQLGALFSPNAGSKPPQHVYTAVSGTLAETTVARDLHGATVVWNVVDPQVRYTSGASVDPIYAAQLSNDLQLPFVMRVGNDGRIERVAASPDASQLGTQFMRAVLGIIEIVAPASATPMGHTWTVSEPDADGPRTSAYALNPWVSSPFADATVTFTRATTVTITHPATSLIHRPNVLGAGKDRGVWRLDGSLDSLTSGDARNTYYGQTLVARSQSALGIKLVALATLDDKRLAASRAYARRRLASSGASGLHVELSDEDVARGAFANVLGTDDEQTLSARLIDATKRAARTDDPTLARKFAALFFLHPLAVADFKPVLRGARADSIPFDVLVSAFQQAGTPGAQSVLAEVAELRAGEPHAGEALVIALGFLPRPIARVDDALEYVVQHGEPNAADSAELARGSVAGTLAGVDDARAAAIVARIEQRLAAAKDDDAKRTELLALGNAHEAGSIKDILSLAAATSADVRSAVATALRGVADPAADHALRGFLGDAQPEVRVAAVTAFESRTPSAQSVTTLMAAMQHDPDAEVRARAVAVVWNARSAFPQADAAVRAARHDANAGVRNAVEFVLTAPVAQQERPVPPDPGKLSPQ